MFIYEFWIYKSLPIGAQTGNMKYDSRATRSFFWIWIWTSNKIDLINFMFLKYLQLCHCKIQKKNSVSWRCTLAAGCMRRRQRWCRRHVGQPCAPRESGAPVVHAQIMLVHALKRVHGWSTSRSMFWTFFSDFSSIWTLILNRSEVLESSWQALRVYIITKF